MDRHDRKLKKDRTDEVDPDLWTHIQTLGHSTVESYLAWCAQHGFSRRTNKHWRLRLKERAFAHRAIAKARLAQKKQETRRPDKIIERIFKGELDQNEATESGLKVFCRAFKSAKESPQSSVAFQKLIQHVSVTSGLISGQPVINEYGWQAGNTFIDGLLAFARHSRNWIRLVAAWKPTHNARRQFASLARHLFAEWPIPTFMDSVWFQGNSRKAVQQQEWFLHIGSGRVSRQTVYRALK